MNRPSTTSTAALWRDGLWNQNPGLVKLLGLCPLLAVSNTAVNGFGLGVATLLTLLVTSACISVLRHHLEDAVRLPVQVLVIASTVTAIEMSMAAWLPSLHTTLGIFLPLIVTNCLILGRSEAFASRQPLTPSLHDAAAMGTGFLSVLMVLGACRELIGQGTVLADIHLLHTAISSNLTLHLFDAQSGLLLALLPPGAFIALGLLLALYNLIEQRKRAVTLESAVQASASPPDTRTT